MEERKCAMCNHTKAVEEFTDKTKKMLQQMLRKT